MANELTQTSAGMASVFASLVELAANPDVDAGKMEALVNLQLRMMDQAKLEEFSRDKVAALLDMPRISKNGEIRNGKGLVQSRYSRWEDIDRAVRPILSRHNLVLSFEIGHDGAMVTVRPLLSHRNGYIERGDTMALPIDTSGSKNGTQGAGSAASYGKRHTAKAILNIVEDGEDDDGQAASARASDVDWGDGLRDQAMSAAARGLKSYGEFFSSLSPMRKGWLVEEGHHEKFKAAAAAHGE